ncbi:hypothetical protein [Listeria booriae]|uniref:Uncharacterized protein n=1 Tax=Listeria booriae TaxID=1552123 RepID=A0A7X0XV29_9LIST|nr:hypothetical protein [Listeria booriae]MBC1780575.1 hypothetical protein [Listeria booriae]
MKSGDREIKDEDFSGKRKPIRIDLENIDSAKISIPKKIDLDGMLTTVKMFSALEQQNRAMSRAIRGYENNTLSHLKKAVDLASSNVFLMKDTQIKLNDSLSGKLNKSQNNLYKIPDLSGLLKKSSPFGLMKQNILVGTKISDISKGLALSQIKNTKRAFDSLSNLASQNIVTVSRFFKDIQYMDAFKKIDIQDSTKDRVNMFSSELITVSEDFPLSISLNERTELISFLESSLDKLTKFETESYVLYPHQYFLTDKIIKSYRSNNYFYIPFIGFSLIDSLFKDVLQTIKETQNKLTNSWVRKQSNGKSALAYNSIYNIDFNFNEMHQVEIYSLFGVYEKLYANYEDNYSGNLNRNAVMHGDWSEVEGIGKYEALRIMQFIVVLEKNIDMIQKVFQNHIRDQLLLD